MPKSPGLTSPGLSSLSSLSHHDGRSHSHPPALHSAPGTAVLDAPPAITPEAPSRRRKTRTGHTPAVPATFHAHTHDDHHGSNHQAELFYLQKQIQQQTQMIFVLEDGARVQGVIEWYDRHSIKVRGKFRVLIYKSAVKYLYKAGELGSAPGE